MAAIVGIGGIFVRSRDPAAYRVWYRDVLGLDLQDWGGVQLWDDRDRNGRAPRSYSVFAAFGADSGAFEPSERDVMINFRVDDLDGMLAAIAARGGAERIVRKRNETEDGRFGYVLDPEGVLIELWEPPRLL